METDECMMYIYECEGRMYVHIRNIKKNKKTSHCFIFFLWQGGNCDLPDTNGCTVTHIMVVYDNIASKCHISMIYGYFKGTVSVTFREKAFYE